MMNTQKIELGTTMKGKKGKEIQRQTSAPGHSHTASQNTLASIATFPFNHSSYSPLFSLSMAEAASGSQDKSVQVKLVLLGLQFFSTLARSFIPVSSFYFLFL
jgi:hypothetical protein